MVACGIRDAARNQTKYAKGKTSMTPTEKAISKIEAHEKECAIRYQGIEQRLQDGSKRFDRLELMIWGVYATVVVAVALPQFLT